MWLYYYYYDDDDDDDDDDHDDCKCGATSWRSTVGYLLDLPHISGHGSSSSSNFRSRSDLSMVRLGRWLSHTINLGQVEPCLSLWLLTGWAVDWAVLSNHQITITALTAEQGTTAQTQATLAAAQIQPDLLDPAWCYSKVITQKKNCATPVTKLRAVILRLLCEMVPCP